VPTVSEFSRTADAIGAVTSTLEKTRLLANYFRTLDADDSRLAATYMSGRVVGHRQRRVLRLGWRAMVGAVQRISGRDDAELSAVYLRHSDLGDVAHEVLEGRTRPQPVTLRDVSAAFSEIEAAAPAAKSAALEAVLSRVDALSAKYLVKILSGELRIGLQTGLVEAAIASAFELPLAAVRRTHMLTGDIGETAHLARRGRVDAAQAHAFQPIRFMLASPVDSPEEAMERVGAEMAWTEEKYDGVRCQLHREGERVALYSRDLKEVTESFPDIAEPARSLGRDVILDGELLAHRDGRVMPFFALQRRLGRKNVGAALTAEVPVVLVAFDVLSLGSEVLLELPLRERRARLEGLELEHPFLLARLESAASSADLERIFVETRERGNEGLMVKDPESAYTPGRRGMAWLKLKRPLATLDCVVTAVEWGHGKRRGVLSDYTFAVWDEAGERLTNVGKAYTGLTDAEIAQMTEHFLASTVLDQGRRRIVRPDTVVEVAFDAILRSGRHASGYALRFPRIVRLRPDKPVTDIDTLAGVAALHERLYGDAAGPRLSEVAEVSA
jgi:DNA ligase-1